MFCCPFNNHAGQATTTVLGLVAHISVASTATRVINLGHSKGQTRMSPPYFAHPCSRAVRSVTHGPNITPPSSYPVLTPLSAFTKYLATRAAAQLALSSPSNSQVVSFRSNACWWRIGVELLQLETIDAYFEQTGDGPPIQVESWSCHTRLYGTG